MLRGCSTQNQVRDGSNATPWLSVQLQDLKRGDTDRTELGDQRQINREKDQPNVTPALGRANGQTRRKRRKWTDVRSGRWAQAA